MTSPWIYVVPFAIAAIDGFFPPVPSETISRAAAHDPQLGALIGIVIAVALGLVIDRIIAWRTRARAASHDDPTGAGSMSRGAAAEAHAGVDETNQPSSSTTPKITGTQPSVVRNTVSRAMGSPTS